MCGIVGAVAHREVVKILVEGLRRLEYRGYDSAGVAVISADNQLQIQKAVGKVQALADLVDDNPMQGSTGIAHTRWATHGSANTANAHPHSSGNIAVVHNGIIENYRELRTELKEMGYQFHSETDTETIAHLLHSIFIKEGDLLKSLQIAIKRLHGAYGLSVTCSDQPGVLLGARSGSPLVVGLGIEENFLASDVLALRQVTDRFIYLEEGDVVRLSTSKVEIFDA
ncbi:MAG: glutamine--fructose-6-phosphate aminotransferase, partial [Alteromonadaceae bacterium]